MRQTIAFLGVGLGASLILTANVVLSMGNRKLLVAHDEVNCNSKVGATFTTPDISLSEISSNLNDVADWDRYLAPDCYAMSDSEICSSKPGIVSGLAADTTSTTTDEITFFAITDRGPNLGKMWI